MRNSIATKLLNEVTQRKEELGVGKKTPFLQFESKSSQLDSMSIMDPDQSSEEDYETANDRNNSAADKIDSLDLAIQNKYYPFNGQIRQQSP